MANDERFLFMRIEVGDEINLQNDNAITLYIDTDNDASTGPELEWNFGQRSGTPYSSAYDIGLVTMPTITSTEFEIAIARTKEPFLSANDTIHITFIDGDSNDKIPAENKYVTYVFSDKQLPPIPSLTIKRLDKNHLRILSYNVLYDGLWEPSRAASFERILTCIHPDIIGFQEIYNHTAEELKMFMEYLFQEQYYSSKVTPDIIAVSRYPIENTYSIEGNGAFLLDLRPYYDTDLLLIVAHPPCCTNDIARQLEIDAIMAFIRDNTVFELEKDTPIIIIGDMNLVGYAEQLETLLTGTIVNLDLYGPTFKPDWDGTDFTALLPRQTDLAMSYTWYDESNSFSPGRLDYMIYSDSVIEPGNHFILFTPEMAVDSLIKYGLQSDDAVVASDHLPIVGDFNLKGTNKVKSDIGMGLPDVFYLEQNYPNPFNSSTVIGFYVPRKTKIKIALYDLLGREVYVITQGEYETGRHELSITSDNLTSGIYFCSLKADRYNSMKKLLVLR